MSNQHLIVLVILITIIIVSVLIDNIKKRAYQKGFKAGQNEVTRSMLETSNWLGVLKDKSYYNTLWLFAARYINYGYVSSDSFRKSILELNHEVRITDLSDEQKKELF